MDFVGKPHHNQQEAKVELRSQQEFLPVTNTTMHTLCAGKCRRNLVSFLPKKSTTCHHVITWEFLEEAIDIDFAKRRAMTTMTTRRNRRSNWNVKRDKIKRLDPAMSFTSQKSNFVLTNPT